METNDLKGQTFEKDGKRYVICAGIEGGEIAFAEAGTESAVLRFCCDARLSENRLFGTYFVTYMVTKSTFFQKNRRAFQSTENRRRHNRICFKIRLLPHSPGIFAFGRGNVFARKRRQRINIKTGLRKQSCFCLVNFWVS